MSIVHSTCNALILALQIHRLVPIFYLQIHLLPLHPSVAQQERPHSPTIYLLTHPVPLKLNRHVTLAMAWVSVPCTIQIFLALPMALHLQTLM